MSTTRMRMDLAAQAKIDAVKKTTPRDVLQKGAVVTASFLGQAVLNQYLPTIPAVNRNLRKLGEWCPVDHLAGIQQVHLWSAWIEPIKPTDPALPKTTWGAAALYLAEAISLDVVAAMVAKAIYHGINQAVGRPPEEIHPLELASVQTAGTLLIRNGILKPLNDLVIKPVTFDLFSKTQKDADEYEKLNGLEEQRKIANPNNSKVFQSAYRVR